MFKSPNRNFVFFLIFIFIGFYLLQNLWMQASQYETIPYSKFEELLDKGEVKDLLISEKYIRGSLTTAEMGKNHFVTVRVDKDLSAQLAAKGVTYTQEVESTFFKDLLSWVVPVLLFVGIWIFISRRMMERSGAGSIMGVGKSRAKQYVETDIKIGFEDVAGVDEAKDELREVVEFLKDPKSYERLGARMPKGILLIGPPGTGKTLLAKAVAGEAHVPFFSMSGSEFVELFVGVGASRVRDLFEQARQSSPCIIFIDELDALGKVRAPGIGSGGHDEKEQTLNQLLAELDGFDTRSGVILLAATNRPEVLDPALLRAGRFDRQVLVDRPDKLGREQILQVHIKKIKAHPGLSMKDIAALTSGFTGADLANLVNEAALVATRRNSVDVEKEDFVVAIERLVAGLEKKTRVLSTQEKERVAYHEMGHALVACALADNDMVHKVSIIPRGMGALGYTIQRPVEDRYLMTKQELIHKMAVLMGGRAAEYLVFKEISTGASDDLVKVTDIAEAIVTRYGMSEELGEVVYEQQEAIFLQNSGTTQRVRSEESAAKIDLAVNGFVERASLMAKDILLTNRDVLNRGAQMLLEKETLNEEEVIAIAKELKVPKDRWMPPAAPHLDL